MAAVTPFPVGRRRLATVACRRACSRPAPGRGRSVRWRSSSSARRPWQVCFAPTSTPTRSSLSPSTAIRTPSTCRRLASSSSTRTARPVSLAGLRGRTVALTFLDPVCTSDCPLIAQEFKEADSLLGGAARVQSFVAVVANPIYRATCLHPCLRPAGGPRPPAATRYYLTGSLPEAFDHVWDNYADYRCSSAGSRRHGRPQRHRLHHRCPLARRVRCSALRHRCRLRFGVVVRRRFSCRSRSNVVHHEVRARRRRRRSRASRRVPRPAWSGVGLLSAVSSPATTNRRARRRHARPSTRASRPRRVPGSSSPWASL